jgi:hypothetical protein
MSTTTEKDLPDPRDEPKEVIREELGEYRDELEALADLGMGKLSQDAERALNVLQEVDGEGS